MLDFNTQLVIQHCGVGVFKSKFLSNNHLLRCLRKLIDKIVVSKMSTDAIIKSLRIYFIHTQGFDHIVRLKRRNRDLFGVQTIELVELCFKKVVLGL